MKTKFLMVLPVLALLGSLVGFANTLSISGVDKLGSGTEVVSPPEIEVTGVEWTIANDYTKVGTVHITVSAIGHTGTPYGPYDFYFALMDSGGGVLAQTSVLNRGVNSTEGIWVFEWDFVPVAIAASEIALFAITVIEAVP